MNAQKESPQAELEELKLALREMIGVESRLALRIIVLEAVIAELLSGMSPDRGTAFAKQFKTRISELMQLHANRLLPIEDAEIALATNRILRAIVPK